MKILVIDGQGGKLGARLIESVLARYPLADITAVGTNSAAAQAMLKSGAARAATGENAAVVACRSAEVIMGPLGIVVADALLGEISPAMAAAVAQSAATRILVPVNRCDNIVAGVRDMPVSALIEDAVAKLDKIFT